jgi:hypothetical protein
MNQEEIEFSQKFKNFKNTTEIKKYWDKSDPDEESLVEFSPDLQKKYHNLEEIYFTLVSKDSYQNAKEKSKSERSRLGVKENSFIYGEMTFRTLSYIFEVIKNKFGEDSLGNTKNEGVFYDLGSGHGNVCIQAALIHPFKSCIGIEFLSPLHKMAMRLKNKYDKNIQNILRENSVSEKWLFNNHIRNNSISDLNGDYNSRLQFIMPEVNYIKGSFFENDWSDANMVYVCSTCFSKDIVDEIFEKSIFLKKGSFFVNTDQEMPEHLKEHFESITPFQRLMSWGVATIYIHRKK